MRTRKTIEAAAMLEKTIKAAVRKRLKELGAFQYWPVPTVWGTAAVDVIGCFEGRFFAIETKAPGKRPTDRQMFCMDNIREAGGRIFVIDTDEVDDILTTDTLRGSTPSAL